MNNRLFLLIPLMALPAAAAPVVVSDDDLLKLVTERRHNLKSLTPEPKWIQSRIFANLCGIDSLETQQREKNNPHSEKFIKTFVSPAGEAAATGHEATHPARSVLIKEKLPAAPDQDSKESRRKRPGTVPELFTGMLKREKGFNPGSGDWEFFTVSGDAKKITSRGKLKSCIECHRDFRETDFVSRQFFEQTVVKQGADGTVLLHSKDAEVFGTMLRFEPKPEKNTLGFWTNKDDLATWTFDLTKEGTYDVEVLQGCGKGSGGAEVEVRVGGKAFKFIVEDTGHFQNFQPRTVGRISLKKGSYALGVQPLSKPGVAVMDLRSVTLRPVNP